MTPRYDDLEARRDRYANETDKVQRRAVRVMVRAFHELNTIRARDGVPWTSQRHRSDVDEEYFSSVVDELNAVVIAMTGRSAHCHPELYKHE